MKSISIVALLQIVTLTQAENKYWKLLEQAEYERYVNVPAPVHHAGDPHHHPLHGTDNAQERFIFSEKDDVAAQGFFDDAY